MAGRGRGATLPSWLTSGPAVEPPSTSNVPQSREVYGQFDDTTGANSSSRDSKSTQEREGKESRRRRSRSRSESESNSRNRKSSKRSSSRSRSRDRHRRRSPDSKSGGWRPKKTPSNFDVRPPPGVEIPPIVGIVAGHDTGHIYHQNANGGHGGGHHSNSNQGGGGYHGPGANRPNLAAGVSLGAKVDLSPQTRHARRIYVGGIPPTTVEQDMSIFFNDVMLKGLPASAIPSGESPVLSVYLNLDKCFAFIEVPSVEIATACMTLDGIQYTHRSGVYTLRVRRPHDYRADLIPLSAAPPLTFNLNSVHIVNTTVVDGPGKIFVGGLPYQLGDDQVKELLSAFGPLKAFNLVRDPGSVTSKGYGFCEYFDKACSDLAIESLNDMPLADKKLTVRWAEVKPPGGAGSAGQSSSHNVMSSLGLGLGAGMASFNPLMANAFGLPPAYAATPTRILKLLNMVTSADIQDDGEYEDIVGDVHGECSNYGQVIQVLIPRVKSGFPPSAEGLIFVEFADVQGAVNAAARLSGRKFDDKLVVVSYFEEIAFQNRMLG